MLLDRARLHCVLPLPEMPATANRQTPEEQVMSRENPTTEEIDAILQHEYGAYGVELPDWYISPSDLKYPTGWQPENVEVAPYTRQQLIEIQAAVWDKVAASIRSDMQIDQRVYVANRVRESNPYRSQA